MYTTYQSQHRRKTAHFHPETLRSLPSRSLFPEWLQAAQNGTSGAVAALCLAMSRIHVEEQIDIHSVSVCLPNHINFL